MRSGPIEAHETSLKDGDIRVLSWKYIARRDPLHAPSLPLPECLVSLLMDKLATNQSGETRNDALACAHYFPAVLTLGNPACFDTCS